MYIKHTPLYIYLWNICISVVVEHLVIIVMGTKKTIWVLKWMTRVIAKKNTNLCVSTSEYVCVSVCVCACVCMCACLCVCNSPSLSLLLSLSLPWEKERAFWYGRERDLYLCACQSMCKWVSKWVCMQEEKTENKWNIRKEGEIDCACLRERVCVWLYATRTRVSFCVYLCVWVCASLHLCVCVCCVCVVCVCTGNETDIETERENENETLCDAKSLTERLRISFSLSLSVPPKKGEIAFWPSTRTGRFSKFRYWQVVNQQLLALLGTN